jgi:tRNA-splicing ligase RtcB (3'-phosphate/5'-hydroxy nucleic acid ligase)
VSVWTIIQSQHPQAMLLYQAVIRLVLPGKSRWLNLNRPHPIARGKDGQHQHHQGLAGTRFDEPARKQVFDQISRDVPVGRAQHRDDRALTAAARPFAAPLSALTAKHPHLLKAVGKFSNWVNQLGTLGGGNHFIEVCLDEADQVWVMLHSGSRGIGNAIGHYCIELARRDMARWFIPLPDRDLAYFPEGSAHFADYVDRKGAIRARAGDLGIIPGSMGARSYLVRGKGNPESFCSCAHGAGRRMSRTAAEQQFTVVADLTAQTAGVICRKDQGVLDEIPGAYMDIDQVMANQADLVAVVHTLKQVLCVKG